MNMLMCTNKVWKALSNESKEIPHLRKFFAEDTIRGEKMTLEADGILLDYLKNRIKNETLFLLTKFLTALGKV